MLHILCIRDVHIVIIFRSWFEPNY